MKIPKRIQPLVNEGLVDEVLRPLMSGKEADVFVVRCGDDVRCAKIYKEAEQRSFKQAVQYREGRKSRNSRRARAMEKGSKFGRVEQESAWQNAEVDALFRLDDAGVRVPKPYGCFDGVLLMELITDDEGFVAPRLNDVTLTLEQALEQHKSVMKDVQRMLCVGLIHGDLSEFNVLLDGTGPVIIDLPQAVDAAANNNAKRMLERDVNNMTQYYGQFAPELLETKYAKEMWALFETGKLNTETDLTGKFIESNKQADVGSILAEIEAAFDEEQERKARIRDADED
ncbi:serine protein kinase RIO [Shewanella sp. VB17]|uniref:PA4780 family RIO1-like protein kinase n=1 Tax=Shewanella sp. VB17 TaxID=2739432 RepID=UPI00156791B6|nr:PA4780 family RIO1-like protein kinase [Shewanella sp. VB17]NRD72512.1 serine protein kinase RIO [Shewanella sp. VB17]